MGLAFASLELRNPLRHDLATLPARALADTGAIPMVDMDLVVHPRTREVTVHPDRPDIAAGIAKRAA